MKVSRELEAKILAMPGVEVRRSGRLPGTAVVLGSSLSQMREKDFQADVIRLAREFGWKYYHTYSSKRSVAGYPDLTLVRRRRVIFAELKVEGGRLSADQLTWGELLGQVGGNVEYYVWWPSDFDEIVEVLK